MTEQFDAIVIEQVMPDAGCSCISLFFLQDSIVYCQC